MHQAVNHSLRPRLRPSVSLSVLGPLARLAVRALLAVTALATTVALAYLVKSALRIDILPGPSPLHDILYPIIEWMR